MNKTEQIKIERAARLVAKGMTVSRACWYAGISRSTYYREGYRAR